MTDPLTTLIEVGESVINWIFSYYPMIGLALIALTITSWLTLQIVRWLHNLDDRFKMIDIRFVKLETDIDKRFTKVDQRLERLELRQDDFDKRLQRVEKRVRRVEKKVIGLDKKVVGLDKKMDLLIVMIKTNTPVVSQT